MTMNDKSSIQIEVAMCGLTFRLKLAFCHVHTRS